MKLHNTGYFPNFQSQTDTLTALLLLRFITARDSCLRGSTRYFLMCERHEKLSVITLQVLFLHIHAHVLPITRQSTQLQAALGPSFTNVFIIKTKQYWFHRGRRPGTIQTRPEWETGNILSSHPPGSPRTYIARPYFLHVHSMCHIPSPN